MQTVLLYLVIAYVALLAYAFFFSNRMIFLPPRPAGYQDGPDILKIKTPDGAILSARYLPNLQAKYLLLISHGNASDIGYMLPMLEAFQKQGFSVFAYDYHGYGTSTGGRPTEKRAYLDVEAAYQYVTQTLHISPEHIIAYGRSLGAAMALDLAVHRPVAGLILQSPFVTAFRVLTHIPILPFDKFNNLKKINQIHCPLLVIHSRKDGIIPFWQGRRVYQFATVPKQHLWLKRGGHNDLMWEIDPRYWPTVQQFANRLPAMQKIIVHRQQHLEKES